MSRWVFLSLRELEALPRPWLTGLLPLNGARVAGEKTEFAQPTPMRLVSTDQSASDPQPQCPCLPGESTTAHPGFDIKGTQCVGTNKGLLYVLNQGTAGEIIA